MSVNYATGLSSYMDKGKCGQPEILDASDDLEVKINKLIDLFQKAEYVVVLTGAGISTSAGIPDFRGPKGVWTLEEKNIVPKIDVTFETAKPTYTHRALTALHKAGRVDYLISQNVDGLHARSSFPIDSLAELHGNMFTEVCSHCRTKYIRSEVVGTMTLKPTGRMCSRKKSRGNTCRGKLHDTVLDWEDSLPCEDLLSSEEQCRKADLCLCLGTTLQIAPSGDLPLLTRRAGGQFALVNLQRTKHDRTAVFRVSAYVDDVMRRLCNSLEVYVPDFKEIAINPGNSDVVIEDTLKISIE